MAKPIPNNQVFNRPPRIRPVWPVETIELPEPPQAARRDGLNWLIVLTPILGIMIMVGAMAVINQSSNALLFAVPMGAMTLVGVGTAIITGRSQLKRDARDFAERRTFFEEQLEDREEYLRTLYDQERACRLFLDPDLTELLIIASARNNAFPPQARLWERRMGDSDFLSLRIGLGNVPLSSSIKVPQPPRDGTVERRLYEIQQRYAMLKNVPVVVPLAELGSLGIGGPRAACLALFRSLIWQISVLHAPSDVRIAVVHSAGVSGEDWDWLRWLPHTIPLSNDPARNLRMCVSEKSAVLQLMSSLLDEFSRRRDKQAQQGTNAPTKLLFPMLVVIVDGIEQVRDQPIISEIMRNGASYNIVMICLEKSWQEIPSECASMIDIHDDGSVRWAKAGHQWSLDRVVGDRADFAESDLLARRLASVQLAEAGSNQDVPRSVRLFDVLEINDETDLLPPRFWSQPLTEAWHPDVPIGRKAGGKPLYLDLYEHRHGPHGIIAGTTGAGKSVLLQCIIAALAIKHSPVQMQLLLIDFKGGASLSMFEPLPHTAGFVTDLEGRLAERAMTAIKSEIRRRKTLLRRTAFEKKTKVENIHDYRALALQHHLPPLPNLLIIIDEFDEMVKTYQEFVTELVRIVKQGRSLGVHLLVATQQPAKAVSDEIRTQLKFFIALRLGSSEDSREMLLKTDAAFLPTDIPGRAYFRTGTSIELFQVALVTGEYRARSEGATESDPVVKLFIGNQERTLERKQPTKATPNSNTKTTDLKILVRALEKAGAACLDEANSEYAWQPQPIWQPPLPTQLVLADVLAANIVKEDLASTILQAWKQRPDASRWLQIVVGRLDIPELSRQECLTLNLLTTNLAVVGTSGSGKTMLLRTLLLSLALTHSPQDVWCYILDSGGQGLSSLEELPHVGSVIQVRDRDRVRRLIHTLHTTIRERQDLFRATGASDLEAYCRDQHVRIPALLVVIDKLALLREEFDDKYGNDTIIDDLIRLVRLGRPYGVHFIIAADAARDYTYKLLALLDARIALRLPDLYDYNELLGGRITGQVSSTTPGRGLTNLTEQGILDLQIALPLLERSDPNATEDEEQATLLDSEILTDLRETINQIVAAWNTHPRGEMVKAAPILLLPDQLPLAKLGTEAFQRVSLDGQITIPLGQESINLQVASLHLSRDLPHALVLGGRRSGKTAVLQTSILSLARRYSPTELRFIIIDVHKRGLEPYRVLPHCAHYASTEEDVQEVTSLLDSIRQNNQGCRWIVILDDYNIGRTTMKSQFTQDWSNSNNLFGVLSNLATVGSELGIHLIVAANLEYAEEGIIKSLDEGRNGIILWPHRFDSNAKFLGVTLPVGERGVEQPPGRALLVEEDEQLVVQIAKLPADDLPQFIADIS